MARNRKKLWKKYVFLSFFFFLHFHITHTKPVTRYLTNVQWQMIARTFSELMSHPFLALNPTTVSLSLTLRALFKHGHCQPVAQPVLHGASGASERNTLSSCGTHREALIPCCHCQYIWTMMMFPHKYFMLFAASKTDSQCMTGRGNLRSITLKGSRLKVNDEKSLDAPSHEG